MLCFLECLCGFQETKSATKHFILQMWKIYINSGDSNTFISLILSRHFHWFSWCSPACWCSAREWTQQSARIEKHKVLSKIALGSTSGLKHSRKETGHVFFPPRIYPPACWLCAFFQALSRPLPCSWPAAPGGESANAAKRAKRQEQSQTRRPLRLKGNRVANPNPSQVRLLAKITRLWRKILS